MENLYFVTESGELLEGNPNSDINDIMFAESFIMGSVFSEMSTLDTLMNIEEKNDAILEAANGKLEAIKTKMKDFFQKIINFFTDLNARIASSIIAKLSKINKKATLKRDVTVYAPSKDNTFKEISTKVDALLEEVDKNTDFSLGWAEVHASSKASDLIEDVNKLNEELTDEHFDKASETFKKGEDCNAVISGIINDAKESIKKNTKVISHCKKLISQYNYMDKAADKPGTIKFGIGDMSAYNKSLIACLNLTQTAYRKVDIRLLNGAKTLLVAMFVGEKEEKKEEK